MKLSINIDNKISFCTRMSENVFWVPVNVLGKSKYSDYEMNILISKTPEEKFANVQTLYEAVQLFQISDFIEREDNQKMYINNLLWEFHKPGFYSVLYNFGCCASDTSWLLYILNGKYEEVGVFSMINEYGGGHSLNYLFSEGWYYFVDLLTQERKYSRKSCPETGNLSDFTRSSPTGIFIKAKTVGDFAKYLDRFFLRVGIKNMYYHYPGENECIPVAVNRTKESLECFFPKDVAINFINERNPKVVIKRVTIPKINVTWGENFD